MKASRPVAYRAGGFCRELQAGPLPYLLRPSSTSTIFSHQTHNGSSLHIQIDVIKYPITSE